MAGARVYLYLALFVLLGSNWLPVGLAQGPLTCASASCPGISLKDCAAREVTQICSLSETRCITIVVTLSGFGVMGVAKGCIEESACPANQCLVAARALLGPGIQVSSCRHDCCQGAMCNAAPITPPIIPPSPPDKNGLISILQANIAFLQGILRKTLPVLRSHIQRQPPVCTALIRKLDYIYWVLNDFLKAKIHALQRIQRFRRDSVKEASFFLGNDATKSTTGGIVTRLIKQLAADEYRDPHGSYQRSRKNYRHHQRYRRHNNHRQVYKRVNGRDELIKIINQVIVTEQSFIPKLMALVKADPSSYIAQEASSLMSLIEKIIATLRQCILVIQKMPTSCPNRGYYSYRGHGHRHSHGHRGKIYGDAAK